MLIRLPDGTVAQVETKEGLRLVNQGKAQYAGERLERADIRPALQTATVQTHYATR